LINGELTRDEHDLSKERRFASAAAVSNDRSLNLRFTILRFNGPTM
jgi:hypothetical protein